MPKTWNVQPPMPTAAFAEYRFCRAALHKTVFGPIFRREVSVPRNLLLSAVSPTYNIIRSTNMSLSALKNIIFVLQLLVQLITRFSR